MKPEKPKKSQLNTIVRFSGVGIQMGVTIWLGVQLGKWLDQKYPNEKGWFTIACTLFAVVASMVSLVTQLNKMNKD
ncbi:MAG: AtpZ/AtpI family protein [Schleiferiaceae bacterium]|jgi:F0F1-type ATP synthase assembly protein I|nr:AtpZ/AtpI family protein [Schleiferiaceae bacterium]